MTVAPTVHMNGTSRQSLLNGLSEVWDKLEQAREALKQAAPNGRDYYIGNVTLAQAVEQQMDRMKQIDTLQASIHAEMDLICEQEDGRCW